MSAAALISKTFRPVMQVGQVYARKYGTNDPMIPVGNVLELTLSHSEEVKSQKDMTTLGGGLHAEVRRVDGVEVTMSMADINVSNLARATRSTVRGQDAGNSTSAEVFAGVVPGSLLPLRNINPSAVTVTAGASAPTVTPVTDELHENVDDSDAITLAHTPDHGTVSVKYGASLGAAITLDPAKYVVLGNTLTIGGDAGLTDISIWVAYTYTTAAGGSVVSPAGNYDVRPAGIFIRADAADINPGDTVSVSYSWSDQVALEALTVNAVELELLFEGLNEADGGAPCILNIWRCSQSITDQLGFISDDFQQLEVKGSVLKDASRVGVGISPFYRQMMAEAA